MQEYKSTVSSASSAVFESTETLLYYIGEQKRIFQPYEPLFRELVCCSGKIRKEEYTGYGAKEDAKYKADGIMRLLVILAAVGGGCIIFDNLVLNPVLLLRSGTAFTAFYAVQYGSRIAGALLLFIPLFLYMKGKKKRSRHLKKSKDKAEDICRKLYYIYKTGGENHAVPFVIPFEYSDPEVLSRLYDLAYQKRLKTVKDTINIYEKQLYQKQWNNLEKEAGDFEKRIRGTLRNYALLQLVSPSEVNIHVR